MAQITDADEMMDVVELATKFLVCGTSALIYHMRKWRKPREKNRRLGLGLMGMHEWLIQRGSRYEVTPELHRWLAIYKGVSDRARRRFVGLLASALSGCAQLRRQGRLVFGWH